MLDIIKINIKVLELGQLRLILGEFEKSLLKEMSFVKGFIMEIVEILR